MEELYKQLIPYICEDFITVPLWEEGDYRPSLKIWVTADDEIYKAKLSKFLQECHHTYSKYGFYCDKLSNIHYINDKIFDITIYQKGYILDIKNPEYCIKTLMELAVKVIKEWEKIRKSLEN